MVDLSVRGACHPDVLRAKAVLDAGARLKSVSASVAPRLRAKFFDVTIVGSIDASDQVQVAYGRALLVTRKMPDTCSPVVPREGYRYRRAR